MTDPPTGAGLPAIPVRREVPCLTQPCSACCHDIEMILTEADRDRISTARPGVDFWSVAPDGFLQLRTREGPVAIGAHAAPGATPRPCIFLGGDGLCTIHPVRPEGCRLYPAVWDEDLGMAEIDRDYCVYPDAFVLAPATRDAARRLARTLMSEREARTRSSSMAGSPPRKNGNANPDP